MDSEKKLKELKEQEAWLVKKIRDFREGSTITIDARFVEVNQKLSAVRKEIKELEENINASTD